MQSIKEIYDSEEIGGGDLIKARTLRNKLEEEKYKLEAEKEVNFTDVKIDENKLRVGDRVYVDSMKANGEILCINKKKRVAEVSVGAVRVSLKFDDLYLPHKEKKKKVENSSVSVRIDRANFNAATNQINVIGKNTDEALAEVENFLDQAVVNNLNEVKIIHGVGLKILSTAIHDMLKKDPRVAEFRFGKYGEGEHGVTFVTLK